MKKLLITALIATLAVGCMSLPKRESKAVGVIGIRIVSNGLIVPNNYDGIFFVRLKNPNDLTSGDIAIYGDYIDKKYNLYAFNVPAGTYVAVAVAKIETHQGNNTIYYTTDYTLLPKELVEKTKIKVTGNKIAYMGAFKVITGYEKTFKKGDDIQKFYNRILFKKHLKAQYNGELKKTLSNREVNEKFMEQTYKYLEKTEWKNMVKQPAPKK